MAMINEAWFHRFKAAQRDLIKVCGGIERCAEITSLSKSQIGRLNNATNPDLMTIDVIRTLENECGIPIVTTAQAAQLGYRLVSPEEDKTNMGSLLATVSDFAASSAEFVATASRAFADGKVTAAEATELERALITLEIKIPEIRQQLAGAKVAPLRVVGGGY